MRVLLIHRVHRSAPGVRGIYQKMAGIRKAFQSNDCQTDEICPGEGGVFLNGALYKAYGLLGEDEVFKRAEELAQTTNYDLYYVRFSPISWHLYPSLRAIASMQKQACVLLEFANFPFEYELNWFRKIFYNLLFKRRESKWKEVADFALHLGQEESIWQIPTIPFENGIDVDNQVIKKSIRGSDKEVRLLYVGKLWKWNALDRLMSSMARFNVVNEKKFFLQIVGDGPQLESLMALSSQLNLGDYVEFQPPVHNAGLDILFDRSDLGVGTLQHSSRKLPYAANLKHRNYAARGLPFFSDVPDFGFDTCKHGLLTLDAQSWELDEVWTWYESNIRNQEAEVSQYLNLYAQKHFDWELIIGRVMKKLNPKQ